MPNYFSRTALLLAIPELKQLAPERYTVLIAQAERTGFTTQLSHWRAVLAGLALCLFWWLAPGAFGAGHFFADFFASLALGSLCLFAVDYWYLRILRTAVLAQLQTLNGDSK